MAAGAYNRLITIQQRTEASVSAGGEPSYTWATFATLWVKAAAQGGRTFAQARESFADLTHIFTGRFVDGINPSSMRVLDADGSTTLEILAAYDPIDRRKEVRIICRERI